MARRLAVQARHDKEALYRAELTRGHGAPQPCPHFHPPDRSYTPLRAPPPPGRGSRVLPGRVSTASVYSVDKRDWRGGGGQRENAGYLGIAENMHRQPAQQPRLNAPDEVLRRLWKGPKPGKVHRRSVPVAKGSAVGSDRRHTFADRRLRAGRKPTSINLALKTVAQDTTFEKAQIQQALPGKVGYTKHSG